MKKEESVKVSLQDWKNILYKMDYYKHDSGYVSKDEWGDLTYFVSEPSFGGVFITREKVLYYIFNY